MAKETKPIVRYEDTLEKLDIRLGRIISCELCESAPKLAYIIKADFGKYGIRQSVGRFTQHSQEDLKDKLILGVLNFEAKNIGGVESQFLCLGVQYPKADSGEATIVTPVANAEVGGKLF